MIRIRIVDEPHGGFNLSMHPIEHRPLRIGDVIEANSVQNNGKGNATYTMYTGQTMGLSPDHYEVVGTGTAGSPCSCSLDVLMTTGCRCGGS